MKRFLQLLFASSVLFTSSVHAACKSNEALGPSNPSDTSNRIYRFTPSTRANVATYATDQITITTYNIQSGLNHNCQNDIQDQTKQLKNCHYFAFQEVDIGSTHCQCSQPQIAADNTGKMVAYLRTIYNQGGTYGHGSGSVYNILETRYKLFNAYSSELRGILAQRTQPPQLKGRDLWLLGTHFQFGDVNIRARQAAETVAYAKALQSEFPRAVIFVLGDLYTQFGDASYSEMAAYFKDSWYEFSGTRTGGSTYPSNMPESRDDLIWYHEPQDFPIVVRGYEVIDTQDSDHAPLRINFGFPALYSTTGSALPVQTPYFPGGTGSGRPGSGTVATAGSSSSTTGGSSTPRPSTGSSTSPTPTPAPSACRVSFSSFVQSSWVSGTQTYTQYHVTITNIGVRSINNLILSAGAKAGDITSFYSVSKTSSGQFSLMSYAYPFTRNSQYTFGYTVKGNTPATFTVASSSC